MTPNRTAAVLGAAAAVALSACQYEPPRPVLVHALNAREIDKNEDLAEDPAAQDRLRGALEMLFGTPSHPSFMKLEGWEVDPNDGGYAELSDEEFDVLKADNRRAFRAQIEAIRAGDFEGVPEPLYADRLWQEWLDHKALLAGDPDAVFEEGSETTWRERAIANFEGWYPMLAESSEMYRQQCFHCHGSSGGGDGSTARFLDPLPRDYRAGKFKFTSVGKARPRRADLLRILQEGVYTTAMPSFARFSLAQLNGLVDYVRLLAMRGEVEGLLILDFDPAVGIEIGQVQAAYELVWERWQTGGEKYVRYEGEIPAATPERIAHGRFLFLGDKAANCIKCHGASGRGDGASAKERDAVTGEMVWAKDEWGNPIQPRDLTRGVFRLGRRPIDIYRRIYSGITGTPMPEHFGMMIEDQDGSKHPLNESDVWDLVHYVRSLSTRAAVAGVAPEHGALPGTGDSGAGEHGGH
jgi:mono/diheme cytochrome c family protein